MKIHLFGASGAGVTTLGTALAAALDVPYFDSDDYFWAPSSPPFSKRRPEAERNARLAHDLARGPRWVLGGSLVGWGPWGEQQLAMLLPPTPPGRPKPRRSWPGPPATTMVPAAVAAPWPTTRPGSGAWPARCWRCAATARWPSGWRPCWRKQPAWN